MFFRDQDEVRPHRAPQTAIQAFRPSTDLIRRLAAHRRVWRSVPFAGVALALAACASDPAGPAPSRPAAVDAPNAAYDAKKPAFRVADVIGRNAAEVDGLLGAPALVRKEGAGELRRYDLAACSLLVLMLDDGKGAPSAQEIYASRRASDAAAIDAARCLGVGRGAGV